MLLIIYVDSSTSEVSLKDIIQHYRDYNKEDVPLDYIDRHEFDQYSQRMEDEHARQNHRITELEKISAQNNQLLLSVNKLATSMENMQKELTKQGGRLEVLESRDGEKWRNTIADIIKVLIGAVITFLLTQIGIV